MPTSSTRAPLLRECSMITPRLIFICPTGGNKAYHPEGEIAVARAAKAGGHLEMLATPASTSIEDAMAARGGPVWY